MGRGGRGGPVRDEVVVVVIIGLMLILEKVMSNSRAQHLQFSPLLLNTCNGFYSLQLKGLCGEMTHHHSNFQLGKISGDKVMSVFNMLTNHITVSTQTTSP